MNKNRVFACLQALGLLAIIPPAIRAQSTDTWVGGSGNNFSTLANWSYSAGSGPVAAGDSLIFDTVGSLTPYNDLTGLGFPSITFNGGAPSYTISGNIFTNGTSTASTIISVNSSSAQTINNNIILGNANQTISLASGDLTLGGVLSGAGTGSGLTLQGGSSTSTLTLNGANTYAGATTNSVGIIKIGNASALASSRLYVAQGATVDLNGNNLSVAFLNNVGGLTAGIIDNNGGGSVTLKVGGNQGGVTAASGTYTALDAFSGVIQNTTGTVGLTKVSAGTGNQSVGIMATASLPNGANLLRLENANTYSGATTVAGGMLELNFGQANNGGSALLANILPSTTTLILAGGDLIMDGVSGSPSQTVAGLTLNAGASHVGTYKNSSTTYTLTLNGITRNAGSTLDLQSKPIGGSSNQRIGGGDGTTTTTNINANFAGGQTTILGGYATWNCGGANGGTWAVSGNTANTAKTITALAAYTTNAAFAAGKDIDAIAGTSIPAAMTINSLRFTQAGAATVNSSGNIVIATGGILENPLVGANAVAINNNNLTSGNGQDLIIHQYNTAGGMTIGANVVDNGGAIGLTKSGQGALTLTPNAANTFSGQLTINGGSVTLGNGSALNGVPALVFGGTSETTTNQGFVYANGTLTLNGNSATVYSLAASADSSGTAIVQNASATPVTFTVNGSATTSFTGTIQDGTGGGALSFAKNGLGTLTLGGTANYSGSTTVGAGTLILTTPTTNTPSYAINGTLNVSALPNSTLALTNSQTLSGSGTEIGNVTVASGAHTRPGATGVTNTITGNLTYSSGAKVDFDLNTSATSGNNDQIILSGTSSVLACGSVNVNINLMGATLDTNNDYVLFSLPGGSSSISGTFNAAPTWLGTVPANSGSYSIRTDSVNRKVLLHFTHAVAPVVMGAANPSTVVRNQGTVITVTNTPGGGTITNVYVDLSALGGGTVKLVQSSVANVYTNTITIPAAAPVGNVTVPAYATDTTPLTGSGSIALNIVATSEIWNGNGADANWSTNPNWVSGLAPGLSGDSLTFDGTTQLAPVMDNSYSASALKFLSSAGGFTISAANGGILTLAGGMTNFSANDQTLSVPVNLLATQTVNTAAGNIALSGVVSGIGGLTKVGNSTLTLTGANTFSGGATVYPGTLAISQAASLGSGMTILLGGTLSNTASFDLNSKSLTVPAGYSGLIVMPAQQRLPTLYGSGAIGINANNSRAVDSTHPQDSFGTCANFSGTLNITGAVANAQITCFFNGGSFDGQLQNATVNLDNVSMVGLNHSTGDTAQFGALNVHANATLAGGAYAGFQLFQIGALNTDSDIEGNIIDGTVGSRITKVGTGNLIIGGNNNTFTGPTKVNAGTLTVSGIITASPITNYSGSTLAGTGTLFLADLEAGSQITPVLGGYGTMTLSSDLTINGATNVVYLATTNSDLIAVSGSLNLLGGVVKLVLGNSLTNGVYKLMTYSGSLNGGVANLTLTGFSQAGKVAVLSDATPNEIDLVVTTPTGANLTWAGVNYQNNYWDVASSLNWSNNSTTYTTFNVGDHVTFNDFGAGNTSIDVRTAVQPATMVVTGAQAYVFQSTLGVGRITGPTNSLTVKGTASAEIDFTNDYGGATTIGSGATLTFGNGSGAAGPGPGAISDSGALVFNQTNTAMLGNLTGAGTLTANGAGTVTLAGTYNGFSGGVTIGSGATLQAGIGAASGPLSSTVTDNGTLIMNQSGTVALNSVVTGAGALVQNGSSTLTVNTAQTYQGNTYVNHGTLKLGASNVLPDANAVSGSTGWLVLDGNATNAGTLDLAGFNEAVNVLQGLGGTVPGDITNSAASGTSALTIGNDFGIATNTYAGVITENSAGGKLALVKQGQSVSLLSAANSFSGGTIIKGGMLILGNSGAAGSGTITLSNGAALELTLNGSSSIFPGNTIYVGPGAEATNLSSSLGCAFAGNFTSGDANSTNVFSSAVSVNSSAVEQFQGYTGTVLIEPGAQLRFSGSALGTNGGDNATFEIEGTLNTRNGTPNALNGPGVSLGAITGSGTLSGGGNAAGNGIYTLGAKGIDSTFAGTIQDSANGNVGIIKVGAGRLTLTGTASYTGITTVSNGVLALNEPVSLDNSPTLTLGSSTAVLDVSGRADGTLNLGNSKVQTLSGFGTVNGSLVAAANSPVRLGLGMLTVTNGATINGNLVLQLNRTNTSTHSELVAPSITVAGPLTVTNVGPALQGGDTFQLFSRAVTGFTATNLPTLSAGMYWTNKLAVDGSITVISTGPGTFTTAPRMGSLALTNGNVVINGTGGQAGDAYYLLTSTNLVLPVPQWHTVATNVLSANGNFTFIGTNVVTAGGAGQFFMLSNTNYNH